MLEEAGDRLSGESQPAVPPFTLRTFPPADEEFRAAAAAAIEEALRTAGDADAHLARAQSLLGDRYPEARVSRQDALASLGADEPAWYAFRDGTVLGGEIEDEHQSDDAAPGGPTPSRKESDPTS